MYSTYNIVVRYSYVYNQRIILEDCSDELIRTTVCASTSFISGTICLITYTFGMKADQFFVVTKESEVPIYRKTEPIYSVLLAISIAINVTLASALKRHAANLDEADEQEAKAMVLTLKKIFTVLVFVIALGVLRAVADSFLPSPFLVPTLAVIFLGWVLILYVKGKEPLRKFVKMKLEEKLVININLFNNSVLPTNGII